MAKDPPLLRHLLLLSFPMQGHITPLLQLAHRLTSLYSFRITFPISQALLVLCPDSATPVQQNVHQLLRILPVSDGLPSGGGTFPLQQQAMQEMRTHVESLLNSGDRSSSPRIDAVVSDIFVTWGFDVAASFSLPYIAFFTANATSGSVLYHTKSLLRKGVLPLRPPADSSDDLNEDGAAMMIDCIPGVPPLSPKDLPPSMQLPDVTSHRFQLTLQFFEHIQECHCLLLNTFYELEAKTIDALRGRIPAVYSIGPLLLSPSGESITTGAPDGVRLWREEEECLAWLQKQRPSSVIYVSFGSISKHSKQQLRELAMGLEASEQAFLWVIREDAVQVEVDDEGVARDERVEEALPEGFMGRVKERGRRVAWAPQMQVLSEAAVGGFVSHCGWNSILENISIGGVPMVCWPDKADQMVNRRVVVEEWGIGVEVQAAAAAAGADEVQDGSASMPPGGLVTRWEVERVVRHVLVSEEGQRMRQRAAQLKAVAREAVREGGSSSCNLQAFVQSLRPRCSTQ